MVIKVSIDQCCFAPCFLAIVVSLVNTAQGKSLEETKNKLKTNYFDILMANYMVSWFLTAVQVVSHINFLHSSLFKN